MEIVKVLGEDLPLKISPSFLQNAACPLFLHLRYVKRVEVPYTRMSAQRGSALHLVKAKLTGIALDEGIPLSRIADEQLRTAVAESVPHEIYAEMGNVFTWAALWRDRFELRHKNVVGYEEKMAINLLYKEVAWDIADFRGIVDLIEVYGKKCVVTDYKTTPAIWAQSYLDQHIQKLFYCWLVSKFYPKIEEWVFRVWYSRYGFYAETVCTKREVELFEQRLLAQRDKVKQISSWDPIPGEHCGLCDYLEMCPVAKDTADLPPEIITPEQALRVAQGIRVKEEWVKRGKAKLKTYVENNDDVQMPGWTYGFKKMDDSKYDMEEVERLLREHGIPLTAVSAVNKKLIGKLLKRLEKEENHELAEAIEATKTEKYKTQFKGFKPAGDDVGAEDEE